MSAHSHSDIQKIIPRIGEVSGFFAADLNFRRHPPGESNAARDYPGLTAEKLVNWNKAIHAEELMWAFGKLQSGHATFPSKVLPGMERLSPDFFRRCCELSKAAGMYVVAYTCGGDDLHAFQQHPEWFREYGPGYACLNAPFWDREFEAVQEMLRLFPCDGLFYDMVRFSGHCTCEFCQTAYRGFYGERMPERHDTRKCRADLWRWKEEKRDVLRFRQDTWKRWVARATRAGREIVPQVEISLNHQWLRPDGLPYELLEHFDWYFCEFGMAEWVGEILRAWGGDKPVLCGNVLAPRQAAHLLGRRMIPDAYDTFVDYRTGKLVSLGDARLRPIVQTLNELKECKPCTRDASAIPHAAVLFAAAGNPRLDLWFEESVYTRIVTACVREATRMNLSCCAVEIAERLTRGTLDRHEVIFAPDLGCLDQELAAMLAEWVGRGGVLVAGGLFALLDKQGEILPAFADQGLLGVRKLEGPLDTFSVLTDFRSGGGKQMMADLAALDDVILCAPTTAEPVAFGNVGADENVPLIWRNKVGEGVVLYLAGRTGRRIEEDPEKSAAAMRNCLRTLLLPHIKRAPFRTGMEYPTEVWLNEQPREKRLVMHLVAFEKPLLGQHVSVRADLIAADTLEIVHPASKKAVVRGERKDGYVQFPLAEVHEHMILTFKRFDQAKQV